MSAWQQDHSSQPARFRLEIAGTTWWAGFEPFAIGSNRILWIGILLPESDLVPAAEQHQRWILAVGGLPLILAALRAASPTISTTCSKSSAATPASPTTTA